MSAICDLVKLSEFRENVSEWEDLISFCADEMLDYCDDIILEDKIDEKIDNDISDFLYNNYWYELRDRLNEISTGYEAYQRNGILNYSPLDQYDLEELLDRIAEEVDWDPEDDDESNDEDNLPSINVEGLIGGKTA